MKQFRGSLSRIKRVVERLPETSQDIYGFAGITRKLLLESVDLTYNISQSIDDQSSPASFEIIALKRAGAAFYRKYKKLIDSENEVPDTSHFDDFLNDLSALLEKTKITYIITSEHGLRDDAELGCLREKAHQFKELYDQYSKEVESAQDQVKALADMVASSQATEGKIAQLFQAASTANQNIIEWHGEIQKAQEEVDAWVDDINKCQTDLHSYSEKISAAQTQISLLNEKAKELHQLSNSQQEEIGKALEKCRTLLEETEKTLGNANRVGMAASFRQRKRELTIPLLIWGTVFVASVLGISVLAARYFDLNTLNDLTWTALVFRVSILSPLIWLGWYSARQYGFTIRLKEDYAFKYASSMAYEGYKKAAGSINPELEEILMEFSMYNMAQPPTRLFVDGKSCVKGMPFEVVLDGILKQMPHIDSLTFNTGIGKVTAVLDRKKKKDETEDETE